tara:strand:- start:1788 stop:1967 length:180 start_codon:yes stop_codon:yes gene_type:complete
MKEINVRFFKVDICEETNEADIIEIDETEFLNIDAPIKYERHTIFENGCRQICLIKDTL